MYVYTELDTCIIYTSALQLTRLRDAPNKMNSYSYGDVQVPLGTRFFTADGINPKLSCGEARMIFHACTFVNTVHLEHNL